MSYLYYGPSGSGKTLMVRAVAHETRSLVFDITLSNLKEKFPTLNERRGAIFMSMKCAKNYGPAIIYIDELEKSFPKKGAKKDEKT